MAVRRILTLIICTAIAQHAVTSAIASPRSDPTSGRAVFTGATVPSPTSIWLNPAALGLGAATTEIYAALTSTLDQRRIRLDTFDLGSGSLTAGPSVEDSQIAPGGMLAIVWHPSNRLTLGFEARVPPPELFPKDHDELRYHTLGSYQRDYAATIGVSLRVTSSFFFGASLSHQNTSLRLRYALDTALEAGLGPGGVTSDCGGAPCGVGNPEAAELYDVDVRTPYLATQNLKVTLGAVVQVMHDVWLGIAYHTPPGFDIQTALTGTMVVTRAPRDGGGLVRGGSTVNVSFPASLDAEVRARLPGQIDLHVGGRWEDLSRMQAYDVRGYGSTFPRNDIPEWTLRPRGLRDSFALWAGLEQVDRGETFRFGGRIGVETASVPDDKTSPLTIAPTSFTFDVGGQLRITPNWIVQLSYGVQLFPSVNVDNSAFDPRFQIACVDSGFDYATPGCDAARNGYAIPTADGNYVRIEHALRIGFRYDIP